MAFARAAREGRIQSYSTMEVAYASDAAIEHHTPKRHGETLRQRVRSGEYASESEVIREGLRSFARDQAIEACGS